MPPKCASIQLIITPPLRALVQPAADVAAAPAAPVTGGWPSLGDSKEPLPKKKQRQQQQAVVAPPPPPPAGSREERPAREGRSSRRGSGRGLPLSTLSDSLSAAAKGRGEGKAAAAEKREDRKDREEKEGGAGAAGDKDGAGGDKEGAAAPAAPAPPPPKPSSERGGSGGRGNSGRGSGGGGRGSRSNSSTRLAEMAGGAQAAAGGAATQAAPAAPAPPTPPAPSASIVAAAAASTAPFEQRSSSGGRGGGEGGRGRGRGGRGGSFRAGSSTYPAAAAAAAAPAGNFLYSVAAPVFYPPAAYGVSPSMVGMTGTPVSKLQEAVRNQIDYYFSVGNLVRDVFLRSKMNAEVGAGWGRARERVRVRMCWTGGQAAGCPRRALGHHSWGPCQLRRPAPSSPGLQAPGAQPGRQLAPPPPPPAGLDPAARHRRLQQGPHAHARPDAHRQRHAGVQPLQPASTQQPWLAGWAGAAARGLNTAHCVFRAVQRLLLRCTAS